MSKTWPMWLGAVLGTLAIAFAFQTQAGEVDQWLYAARYTARVGFPLLIIAYIARPLVDLTKSDFSKYLLARRKWFGLGFAISHTIHLAALVIAIEVSGQGKGVVTYVFGGLGYAILYVMAFTSNRTAMKALGKWWKRIHRFGIHYLWFIFAQSYAQRVIIEGTMVEGIVGTVVALGAGAVRFAAWRKQRLRSRPQPAAA